MPPNWEILGNIAMLLFLSLGLGSLAVMAIAGFLPWRALGYLADKRKE